jgi:hypothetical protein
MEQHFAREELEALGFGISDLGGNCVAWVKPLGGDYRIAITDSSGIELPQDGDILVGIYTATRDEAFLVETVEEAIAIVEGAK